MYTPQAKRRRLNEAAKTLHRPFKSPFRTPLDPGTSSDSPSSDPCEPHTLDINKIPRSTTSTTPAVVERHANNTIKPGPTISTHSRSFQKKAASKPSLTREIVKERNDVQILTQAYALATSSKDEDLAILIDKWRTASRAAAEELFASTRDRVNRMGGVSAWREREREQGERRKEWDRQELEAERERLDEQREEGEHEKETYDDYADLGGQHEEEEYDSKGTEGDSFTMDMMLKTLNIDFKLIGYNKEAQRWDG